METVRLNRAMINTPRNFLTEEGGDMNLGSWPKPAWLRGGETEVHEPICHWAQKPCDLLFFGQSCNLLTLALLLERFHPEQRIAMVDAESLDPYNSYAQKDENEGQWGAPLPTASVLFIFDITGDIKPLTLKRVNNLLRSRRGRRLLTVAHSPLSHADWVARVKTTFPFIITDGSV